MPQVTQADVAHVAKLANLTISKQEAKSYAQQLNEIIQYVDMLQDVNTDGVQATFQVLDGTHTVLRKDEVRASMSQDEALSNASRSHKGYVVVKGVLDVE